MLDRFADVVKGKAAVVRPADPASYKGLFRTKGAAVIVPKKKGETVMVGPRGGLVIEKKVAGHKRTRRYIRKSKLTKDGRRSARHRYGIPFGYSNKIFWFPDFNELQKFMSGYNYKNWHDYVIVETDDDGSQLFVREDGATWAVWENTSAGDEHEIQNGFPSKKLAQDWIDDLLEQGG